MFYRLARSENPRKGYFQGKDLLNPVVDRAYRNHCEFNLNKCREEGKRDDWHPLADFVYDANFSQNEFFGVADLEQLFKYWVFDDTENLNYLNQMDFVLYVYDCEPKHMDWAQATAEIDVMEPVDVIMLGE